MHENRVENVFVTNVGTGNTGTDLTSIVAGDILIFNKKNVNLTGTPSPSSATGNEAIRLALGLPSNVPDAEKKARMSDLIPAAGVVGWKKLTYQAPVQRKVEVGGVGATDPGIVVKGDTEYRLKIVAKDRHSFTPHRQMGPAYFYTTPAGTPSQTAILEMALQFARSINLDLRTVRIQVSAEVKAAGTLTELTANATVTNGSNVVTSTGHGFAVGDYASFQDVVYKVRAVVDANTIELDRLYTGASETIVVASTTDKAAKLTAPTKVGLEITGKQVKTRQVDLYQQLDFEVFLGPINGAAGEETVTKSLGFKPGMGYWEQVRDMEFFEAGRRGISNRRDFPIDPFVPIAQNTATYRQYVIEYFDKVNVGHADIKNPKAVYLAFDISSATTKADAVEAILDSWMAGAGLPNV